MWGYFRANSFFFYSEMRVTRRLLCHSDFTKFNYRWGACDTPSTFPIPLDTFGVSQQWVLLVFVVEQNSVGISAVMLVVFYRCLGIHVMRHGTVTWNMTSSTKPEIHNASQRLRKRTEPGPYAACTNNYVKFALWFSSYASGQTDRQTDN